MSKHEAVIGLGVQISRLRAELAAARDMVKKKERQLDSAERQLDMLVGRSDNRGKTARMVAPEIDRDMNSQRQPVTSTIRNFFGSHRGRTYAIKDVVEACGIEPASAEAVRKAFQRLTNEGVICRVREGVYAAGDSRP